MSARSPTEVYLCVNKPQQNNTYRGLIKFTNIESSSNIEWFI